MDTRFLEGKLGHGVSNSWLQNYLDVFNKMKILDGILKYWLGQQKFDVEGGFQLEFVSTRIFGSLRCPNVCPSGMGRSWS